MDENRSTGEGTGGTARSGSVAWLASSAIGPVIHFAADGVSGIADAPGGGDGKVADPAKVADPQKQVAADPAKKTDTPDKSAEKPQRPDWLPETMWDADKGFKKADYDALVAHKAESDSRAASVPDSGDKYEVKLPASFKVPEGIELAQGESLINADDPRVGALREHAVANKLTQADFEQLLGLGAQMDLAERGRLNDAVKKERDKLGTRAGDRVKSVTTWLDAKLGAERAAALHSMMFTAQQVEAFESLMQLNRGDVPGNPGASRGNSDGSQIASNTNMSFREKMAAIDAAKAR